MLYDDKLIISYNFSNDSGEVAIDLIKNAAEKVDESVPANSSDECALSPP